MIQKISTQSNPVTHGTSPKLNEQLAAQIKGLWKQTSLNQAQITSKLGALNQGRVSEVINGQRFADVPPADIKDDTHNDQN